MVAGISIVGEVEKPQILRRTCTLDACDRCEDEDQAMARKSILKGCHGKDEGSGKRVHIRRVWLLGLDPLAVESTTN